MHRFYIKYSTGDEMLYKPTETFVKNCGFTKMLNEFFKILSDLTIVLEQNELREGVTSKRDWTLNLSHA